MQIGIVGFPGSGKTTIFNALTGLRAETTPGARTRENVGVIKVPDPRVDSLSQISHSKRSVYAEVSFVDVAGPPEGAGGHKSLDSRVVQAMQSCDALVLVLRDFENPMLPEAADPLRDLRAFREEMILNDMGPLETRKDRLKKEPGKEKEKALIDAALAHLEAEQPIRTLEASEEQLRELAGFGLLSGKPLLYLVNQGEDRFSGEPPEAVASEADALSLAICGQIEMDIAEMEPAEQREFLTDMGLTESARDRFVRSAYALLDLISFLTTGEDESRAWPVRRGSTAQRAAGRIHSDIERGFIRAEVIPYEELVALGGEKQAKEAGKLRLEGKTYVVQDGDVITFRFNV